VLAASEQEDGDASSELCWIEVSSPTQRCERPRLYLRAPLTADAARPWLRIALAGVVVGLAGRCGVTRVLGSLLHDVSARDPATFGAHERQRGGDLAAMRRAAGLDPLQALREDM
jgi:hypothetical protein